MATNELDPLHKFVWQTEVTLFGKLCAKKPQVPLWLDLRNITSSALSEFQLVPVSSPEHWQSLKILRTEIEVPFGITKPEEIGGLMDEARRLTSKFGAVWYLAYVSNQIIGEIGLVGFDFQHGRIGRLLDVDIAPRFQGQGYGNQLLHAIIGIAQNRNFKALCLRADPDRWVKDWYIRLGFRELGLWHPSLDQDRDLGPDSTFP